MAYKHIEDKRAYQRAYYASHAEERKASFKVWYAEHKHDPEYKAKKKHYMQYYRLRKRYGY